MKVDCHSAAFEPAACLPASFTHLDWTVRDMDPEQVHSPRGTGAKLAAGRCIGSGHAGMLVAVGLRVVLCRAAQQLMSHLPCGTATEVSPARCGGIPEHCTEPPPRPRPPSCLLQLALMPNLQSLTIQHAEYLVESMAALTALTYLALVEVGYMPEGATLAALTGLRHLRLDLPADHVRAQSVLLPPASGGARGALLAMAPLPPCRAASCLLIHVQCTARHAARTLLLHPAEVGGARRGAVSNAEGKCVCVCGML